jgi:magnesium-transporting ATPase (P-type)
VLCTNEIQQGISDDIVTLLVSLALCHTVQVHHSLSAGDAKQSHVQQFEYHSASPDEKALVEACSRFVSDCV